MFKSVLRCILFAVALVAGARSETLAAPPTDDAAIRAATVADHPMIIATITGSRPIARGKRSHQITYDIVVTHVLSGSRASQCNYVAHWSDTLETREWHRGWTYLFIFESPEMTMPSYVESLSRFGSRKRRVIES